MRITDAGNRLEAPLGRAAAPVSGDVTYENVSLCIRTQCEISSSSHREIGGVHPKLPIEVDAVGPGESPLTCIHVSASTSRLFDIVSRVLHREKILSFCALHARFGAVVAGGRARPSTRSSLSHRHRRPGRALPAHHLIAPSTGRVHANSPQSCPKYPLGAQPLPCVLSTESRYP